jgi:3-methyladenine DNA glycosylase AlkD
VDDVIAELQRRLDQHATERRREWWTAYLKGEAQFRGVAMADIRAEVRRLPADRELAFALLRERHTEDKLAGILLLAEHLLDTLDAGDLPLLAAPFDEGAIADWGACDWLAVKVLAPLCRRDGEPFARPLAGWSRDGTLWRRRAPAAAFATIAAKPEPFAGFAELSLDVCAALVRDPQRFAQTGAGWLLRELSKQRPDAVRAFVDEHAERLSTEARRMALAKIEGRGRR